MLVRSCVLSEKDTKSVTCTNAIKCLRSTRATLEALCFEGMVRGHITQNLEMHNNVADTFPGGNDLPPTTRPVAVRAMGNMAVGPVGVR